MSLPIHPLVQHINWTTSLPSSCNTIPAEAADEAVATAGSPQKISNNVERPLARALHATLLGGSIAHRKLCYNSEINQSVGGKQGSVEALFTATQLQGDDREVVNQACVALTNLLNSSVGYCKRIVAAVGSTNLVKLIQRYI